MCCRCLIFDYRQKYFIIFLHSIDLFTYTNKIEQITKNDMCEMCMRFFWENRKWSLLKLEIEHPFCTVVLAASLLSITKSFSVWSRAIFVFEMYRRIVSFIALLDITGYPLLVPVNYHLNYCHLLLVRKSDKSVLWIPLIIAFQSFLSFSFSTFYTPSCPPPACFSIHSSFNLLSSSSLFVCLTNWKLNYSSFICLKTNCL